MSVGLKLHPSLSGISDISTCSPVFTVTLSADYIDLGPLHMSPVDRAGPISEISPHL